MTLNPDANAINLDVTDVEMSPREKQNKFGQKHIAIPNVDGSGYLSIIVVSTEERPTPEQWYSVLSDLQTKVGVTGMQALFEINVPEPEEGYQNNLHVNAHVRQDAKPQPTTE